MGKKRKLRNWQKKGFEFLSIFTAVVSAFALNNWNENRRDNNSESKILVEISNGLVKDIEDIRTNVKGHKHGVASCIYFRNILLEKTTKTDSLRTYYHYLTRDFISAQNSAGYETLKSKGLELIKNDSLRLKIISLYEYDYQFLRKLEEEYFELQFQENYFREFNNELAPNFQMDSFGNIAGFNFPLKLQEDNKKKLLVLLWKVESNRKFTLAAYAETEKKIQLLKESIDHELKP